MSKKKKTVLIQEIVLDDLPLSVITKEGFECNKIKIIRKYALPSAVTEALSCINRAKLTDVIYFAIGFFIDK